LKDPNQKAVALEYNTEEAAPKVTATGRGRLAERIVEKGREADVPIYQDAALTEELTRLDLGEHIPPELYEVVAQVLIFISDLDRVEQLRRETEKQVSHAE
jgi:flagellar biosynthesis protein